MSEHPLDRLYDQVLARKTADPSRSNTAKLLKERGISLEDVAELILQRRYIDVLRHPKRIEQYMFIIPIKGYIHVVPFIIDGESNIVLKTAFPSRKFHKKYAGGKE